MTVLGLFLNPEVRTGGHRRYLELLRGLAERGHDVVLVKDARVELPLEGVRVLPVADVPTFGPLPVRFRKAVLAPRSIVAEASANADTLLIFGDSHLPAAIVAKRWGNTPIVCAIRSSLIEELNATNVDHSIKTLPATLSRLLRRAKLGYVERLLSRNADCLVFQTEAEKKAFLSRRSRYSGRTSVVPNSLTASWFDPGFAESNSSTALRRLLFVGALNDRKGILVLLEALRLLRESSQALHLTVVGFGDRETDARSYIRDNHLEDLVSIEGRVENTMPYYANADLLILPSLYDSFPNVLLEALHVGIPALATRSGGAGEILKDDLLLVPPNDSQTLADRIAELATNPELYARARRICGERAKEFVFDWVGKFETVLEECR